MSVCKHYDMTINDFRKLQIVSIYSSTFWQAEAWLWFQCAVDFAYMMLRIRFRETENFITEHPKNGHLEF